MEGACALHGRAPSSHLRSTRYMDAVGEISYPLKHTFSGCTFVSPMFSRNAAESAVFSFAHFRVRESYTKKTQLGSSLQLLEHSWSDTGRFPARGVFGDRHCFPDATSSCVPFL